LAETVDVIAVNAALGEMNLSALSVMREDDSEENVSPRIFWRVNVSPIMS
jgi:hypothetical protein